MHFYAFQLQCLISFTADPEPDKTKLPYIYICFKNNKLNNVKYNYKLQYYK